MWGRFSRTMSRQLLKISKEEYPHLLWAVFAGALLCPLHSKKCFLILWSHQFHLFHLFHFVPFCDRCLLYCLLYCTILLYWAPLKRALFHPLSRIYRHRRDLPRASFRLNSTSSLSLSSQDWCSEGFHHLGSPLWKLLYPDASLKGRGEEGKLELDTALQVCTNAEQSEKITFIDCLVILCLKLTRIPLVLLASRVHCWILLVPTRTHRSFSEELFSC